MPNCAVFGCIRNNRNSRDVKFYTFPKNKSLSEQWKNLCRRKDEINVQTATVCSVHFSEDSFELPLRCQLLNYKPKNLRDLKKDAIPTIGIPRPLKRPTSLRNHRIEKRERRNIVNKILVECSRDNLPAASPPAIPPSLSDEENTNDEVLIKMEPEEAKEKITADSQGNGGAISEFENPHIMHQDPDSLCDIGPVVLIKKEPIEVDEETNKNGIRCTAPASSRNNVTTVKRENGVCDEIQGNRRAPTTTSLFRHGLLQIQSQEKQPERDIKRSTSVYFAKMCLRFRSSYGPETISWNQKFLRCRHYLKIKRRDGDYV